MMIPMVMILKSCEGDDKGICEIFLPTIKEPEDKTGRLYHEVREVIFENNNLFTMRQELDTKTRANSLTKSLKLNRKTPGVSPERRGETMVSPVPSPAKYKTILGNKSEYTTQTKGQREEKVGEKLQGRKLNCTFYNLLEKLILSIELSDKEKQTQLLHCASLESCIVKVRHLSIELERNNPSEWSTFLDVALES